MLNFVYRLRRGERFRTGYFVLSHLEENDAEHSGDNSTAYMTLRLLMFYNYALIMPNKRN